MEKINVTANCFVHKLGNRQFRITTKFRGETFASETRSQRRGALESLQAVLESRNIPLPTGWKVHEVDPEVTQNLLAKESPKELEIRFDARDEAPILENPEAIECENPFILEAVKVPEPKAPNPSRAPSLDHGVITPVSAKEAWVATYTEAVKFSIPVFMEETSAEDFGPDNNRVQRFRESVNALMKAAGCVGAYDYTPGGDRWVRFAGVPDISVGQIKRKGQRQFGKDINGNIVAKEHGKVGGAGSVEKAKISAAIPKEYTYTGGSEEERKAAYNFAKSLGEAETKRIMSVTGLSVSEAKKSKSVYAHFKAGFLIACRQMEMPVHTKYAAKLKAQGYDLEFSSEGDAILTENGKTILVYGTENPARKAS